MNVKEKILQLEKQRNGWFVSLDTIKLILQIANRLKIRTVLEIGTHIGYSALNFSLVANKVVTIEKDHAWISKARDNCSVAKNVVVIKGDAIKVLQNLIDNNGVFDLIFIDAKKNEYKQYLELSLNLLSKKGVLFVDNTISHKEKLKEFFNFLNQTKLFFQELNVGDGLMIMSRKSTTTGEYTSGMLASLGSISDPALPN